MTSDLNFLSALGPSAGPPPQRGCRAGDPGPGAAASAAPCETAPVDGRFAALIDSAAAATGGEAAGIDPDADAQIGPDLLTFPESWLLGSAAAGQSSSCTADADAAAIDADENSDDEDDAESGEVPLDGILNINWLLGQPVARLPRNLSMQAGSESSQTVASAVDAASSNGDGESLKSVNQPFARTWNMMASLDVKAQAPTAPVETQPAAKADGAAAAQPDLAATLDALVAETVAEVPAEGADDAPAATPDAGQGAKPTASPSVRPRSAAAKLEMEGVIAAQQRATSAAIEANASTALPTDVAAADVAETPGASPRLEPAAARLARGIERSGGATSEAVAFAPTAQPFESLADTSQDGSSAFSPSRDTTPPAPEPVRVAGSGTPVFVVPHAPATAIAGMPSVVATPAAGPSAPLHDADMLQQFVQTMRVQFRDGIGDAVLRLRPEHLGEVSISLRVENGTVAATVNAEAAAVRQWLEANQASLRQGLSEQGLQLDRFVVQRDPEERQSRDEQASPRRQQQRRRNENADTPRFEITV